MTGAPALAERAPRLEARGLLLLVALSLCWGLTWPSMKIVLAEMPLLTFRGLCVAFAGPAMLAVAVCAGERLRIPPRERLPLAAVSFFNVTCWHFFTALGVQLMAPGRAVIIAYTMPVWSALLAALVLRERLTGPKVLGLVFGILGLACLLVPDMARLQEAPFGAIAILAASIAWAIGTIATKRIAWTMSVVQMTGWQLVIGGIPILLAALVHDDLTVAFRLSPLVLAVLIFLLVAPVTWGQWAWFRLLQILPASIASISTLAVPVVGVLASAALLGERVGPLEITALLFVVAALVLVLRVQIPGVRRL